MRKAHLLKPWTWIPWWVHLCSDREIKKSSNVSAKQNMMNIQPSAILCWKLVAHVANASLFVNNPSLMLGPRHWQGILLLYDISLICSTLLEVGMLRNSKKSILRVALIAKQLLFHFYELRSFFSCQCTVQGETSTLSVLSTNETFNLVQRSVVAPWTTITSCISKSSRVFNFVSVRRSI